MTQTISNILRELLGKTDNRTKLVGKNIILTFLLKCWGGILQLLLVPLTLDLISPYEYGIWLTISNLLLWIETMDIGLGNGLRNRLSEAIALQDWDRCRRLTSTTFCTLFLILTPLILTACYLIHISDCYTLLNIDSARIVNLEKILILSILMMGGTFFFKCIGNVYMALQLPSVSNALIVIGQTATFVLLFLASLFADLSLINIVIIYTAAPLLVYITAYPITFLRYKRLSPSIHLFDIHIIKSLFGIGIEFFIAQVSGMCLIATSGILISRLLSPSEVTLYQIAYRYFGILNILFTVISAPLWSATTEAYVLGEYDWIRSTMKKMQKVLLVFLTLTLAMLFASDIAYGLWIGHDISIPLSVSVLSAINFLIIIYSTCYSNIICGIGKIRLLMTISVFNAIIYIPLANYLGTLYGLNGILLAMILLNAVSAIVNRLQFSKLINRVATGLWNR